MLTDHVKEQEALHASHEALIQASDAGHWMIAVWSVKGNQLKLVDRTTWQFPRAMFLQAIEQLMKVCCDDAVVETLPDDPLPLATIVDGCVQRVVGKLRALDDPDDPSEDTSSDKATNDMASETAEANDG